MKIRDSVAFITGANRGIGLAFAQALLAEGAKKVYAAARNPETVKLAGVYPVRLDVTKPDEVAAAARNCGEVSLLINNAGITLRSSFLGADGMNAARSVMETTRGQPRVRSGTGEKRGRYYRQCSVRIKLGDTPDKRHVQRLESRCLGPHERLAYGITWPRHPGLRPARRFC
jgi:NAD(P)-dependent dehydrogenase (short-subunit alcohol dehydrogenase family)